MKYGNIREFGFVRCSQKKYPVATLEIVDMVAKARGTSSDTSTEAELLVRDKAGPFMILETWAEAVAIDKTTNYKEEKREQNQ